jgi:hypothetical protein
VYPAMSQEERVLAFLLRNPNRPTPEELDTLAALAEPGLDGEIFMVHYWANGWTVRLSLSGASGTTVSREHFFPYKSPNPDLATQAARESFVQDRRERRLLLNPADIFTATRPLPNLAGGLTSTLAWPFFSEPGEAIPVLFPQAILDSLVKVYLLHGSKRHAPGFSAAIAKTICKSLSVHFQNNLSEPMGYSGLRKLMVGSPMEPGVGTGPFQADALVKTPYGEGVVKEHKGASFPVVVKLRHCGSAPAVGGAGIPTAFAEAYLNPEQVELLSPPLHRIDLAVWADGIEVLSCTPLPGHDSTATNPMLYFFPQRDGDHYFFPFAESGEHRKDPEVSCSILLSIFQGVVDPFFLSAFPKGHLVEAVVRDVFETRENHQGKEHTTYTHLDHAEYTETGGTQMRGWQFFDQQHFGGKLLGSGRTTAALPPQPPTGGGGGGGGGGGRG